MFVAKEFLFFICFLFGKTNGKHTPEWYSFSQSGYYETAKQACLSLSQEGSLPAIKTENDLREILTMMDKTAASSIWVGAVRVRNALCSIHEFSSSCWKWNDGSDIDTSVVDWDESAYDHRHTINSRVYYSGPNNKLYFDKNTVHHRIFCSL